MQALALRRMALLAGKLGLVVALTYVALRGLDLEKVASAIGALGPATFVTALLLQVATLALSAARWQVCLDLMQLNIGLSSATRIYFTTNFLGTLLPVGIGQDLLRIHSAAKIGVNCARAIAKSAASVLLDRSIGLATFSVCSAPALLAIYRRPPFARFCESTTADWPEFTDSALILALLAVAIGSFVVALLLKTAKARQFLLSASKVLRDQAAKIGIVMIQSFLIVLVATIVVYVIGQDLMPATPLSEYIVMMPLIALVGQLPISILGLGVREAGFVLLFACETATREDALAVSVVYFSVGLSANLLGGVTLLDRIRRQ